MKKYTRYITSLALACSLAACGGGGGDSVGGGGGGGPTGPAWQAAQLLETADSQAGSANVAINADGIGYAVWTQLDLTDNTTKVMSSRNIDGVWEPSRLVSSGVIPNDIAQLPQVVVHPGGRATTIWRQKTADGDSVVYSSTKDDGSWEPTTLIAGQQNEVPLDLKLSADGLGNAMAVFRFGAFLVASYFDGDNFQPPELLNLANQPSSPDIVMDTTGRGTAVVVWVEEDVNNIPRVFARSFVGGDWSDQAAPLSGDEATEIFGPKVSIGANAKAVVTWRQVAGNDPAATGVYVALAANFETPLWTQQQQLGDVDAFGPKPSMNAQGQTVVAWEQVRANGVIDIVASRLSEEGFWINSSVETDDANSNFTVELGMDASGRAFAIWTRAVGIRTDMMANRMDPATGQWGTPELIETEDRGNANFQSLAVSARGRAISAWRQFNGATTPAGVVVSSVMGNAFK